MRICNSSLRVLTISCLVLIGSFVGNGVHTWAKPVPRADHECQWDNHCEKLYSVGDAECGGGWPDCYSSNPDLYWACRAKKEVTCTEDDAVYGSTKCAGSCGKSSTELNVAMPCSFTVVKCSNKNPP